MTRTEFVLVELVGLVAEVIVAPEHVHGIAVDHGRVTVPLGGRFARVILLLGPRVGLYNIKCQYNYRSEPVHTY